MTSKQSGSPRPTRTSVPSALTRRQFLKASAATGALAWLSACTPAATPVPTTMVTATPASATLLASDQSIPLDRLIYEAQKEGSLTTISLDHNWANYGKIIETFKKKYNLKVVEQNPDAGSGEEVDLVRAAKTEPAGKPEVLDIGLGFAEAGKTERVFAPYKVATWDDIPDLLKDPDGYWFCSYYGVITIEVNLGVITGVVLDWDDLLKPEYKGKVALAGNPASSGQGIGSVLAAGYSKTKSFATAPQAGLEFFLELRKAGNLAMKPDGSGLLIAETGTVQDGTTPIALRWDFLALQERDLFKGSPQIDIVIPKSGVLGVPYVQAMSAFAEHPFAARLWEEFLYSDEGQLLWLEGYAHPVRFNTLLQEDKIPHDLAASLPPPEVYAGAAFATVDETSTARQIITENWTKMVMEQS